MLHRLRRCFSSAPSEIGHLLSASSAAAIDLHPGAHAHVTAPAPALVTRRPAQQLVEVASGSGSAAPLAITLPQRMECEVEGGGAVRIHGKLEGSCSVAAAGDIWVAGALRGAYVDLVSAGGRIDLQRVLEGVSSVRAAAGVRCARAMGERLALRTEAGELHVGAAFGELTLEHAGAGGGSGSVHVGGVHGAAHIHSAGAPVTALGVTGRLRVSGAPAACAAQFDSARGECSIVGVAGDVVVHLCPPLQLRLSVAAGRGLAVEAGPGGSYAGGVLVAPAAALEGGGAAAGAEGALAGAEAGHGGSGKIREGGAITGWWSQEGASSSSSGSSGEEGSASLTIACSGSCTIIVQSYADKLRQSQLR